MANPVLSRARFTDATAAPGETTMTLAGTVTKTGILMFLYAATAIGILATASSPPSDALGGIVIITLVLATVIGLIASFVPRSAPYLSPVYAILEGVILGGSAILLNNLKGYEGLALTAFILTLLIGFIMLGLYVTRIVKVTQKFRAIITGAMLGILGYYVIAFVLGLFGVHVSMLYDGGWISIAFSLFVVCIASASFLLDFDQIEQSVNHGAPHYLEWYGAFGVLVTFVWLYFEILRLLINITGRRR